MIKSEDWCSKLADLWRAKSWNLVLKERPSLHPKFVRLSLINNNNNKNNSVNNNNDIIIIIIIIIIISIN